VHISETTLKQILRSICSKETGIPVVGRYPCGNWDNLYLRFLIFTVACTSTVAHNQCMHVPPECRMGFVNWFKRTFTPPAVVPPAATPTQAASTAATAVVQPSAPAQEAPNLNTAVYDHGQIPAVPELPSATDEHAEGDFEHPLDGHVTPPSSPGQLDPADGPAFKPAQLPVLIKPDPRKPKPSGPPVAKLSLPVEPLADVSKVRI
jgi:hypothetical protein